MRIFFRLLLIAVLSIGVMYGCVRPRAEETPATPEANEAPAHWQYAAPGMQARRLHWIRDGQSYLVTALRINPEKWDFRLHYSPGDNGATGARAREICPQRGAAINASFFDAARKPLGLLILDDVLQQRRFPVHAWGAFQVRDGHPELVPSSGPIATGVSQAFESKPRLIIDGAIPSFKTQGTARRSAVGIDGNGQIIFAVTQDYFTLDEWATCLQQRLGCRNALNLDGGSSTQLALRGDFDLTIPSTHTPAAVPVLLLAIPKK